VVKIPSPPVPTVVLRSTAEGEKNDDESDHDEDDARNGHQLRFADRPTAPRSNTDDRDEGNHDADDQCRGSHGMSLYTADDEIAMHAARTPADRSAAAQRRAEFI
jgi:hypothetical protein